MIAADVTNSGPADPSGLPQRGAPQAQSPGYAGLMQGTLWGFDADRLERSCSRRPDSIRFGTGPLGLERAEVYLSSAFEPHRHDTYAMGTTTAGVQTFRYRGSRRVCLPGQLHVLHPDELHDGAAGTDEGFAYRILYIPPDLVRDALGGAELPFVADPVQEPIPATRRIASLLIDVDEPINELTSVEIAAAVADSLVSLSGKARHRQARSDLASAQLAREYPTVHACD